MSSFTPGPWKFQYTDESGECFIIAANLGGMVGAALPWPTEIDARDFRRVIANASLIAAAPDLLEVVKAFVAETIDYATLNKLGDAEQQHNVKWARAVIAKIEGRS
jgi:hypothetical protein